MTSIEVGLLTGGQDKSYASALAMALVSRDVRVDFIGSDELDSPEMHGTPNLTFLNLRGSHRQGASLGQKVSRVLVYYARLLRYAFVATPKVFHILWNNKFELFDRTLLTLLYKLNGRKVVLTAHNVNAGKRDLNDTLVNRVSLWIQYRLADQIFVHSDRLKRELREEFGVADCAVTVIPFGINTTVPNTELSPEQAKQRLGIAPGEKTMLFFGRIGPYKGLETLVAALQRLAPADATYRLVIAGEPKTGSGEYWPDIRSAINQHPSAAQVIQKIEFIPDADTELYFKAADVLILPYTQVFQSGVLFLAYGFGLPVIATNLGAFDEDIIEGRTGFLCQAGDAVDLARIIEQYFQSDLFKGLNDRRQEIRDHADRRHSWNTVGQITSSVYAQLIAE